MKKKIIFIVIIVIIILLGLILFLIEQQKEIPRQTPVLPTPTPVQSNRFLPIATPDMKKEEELERQYGFDRKAFLDEKPWFLHLPLHSSNYFIYYNAEKDQIVADIYFYPLSSVSKGLQASYAKQDALNALSKVGVDINKEKVVFVEKQK